MPHMHIMLPCCNDSLLHPLPAPDLHTTGSVHGCDLSGRMRMPLDADLLDVVGGHSGCVRMLHSGSTPFT